MRARIAAYVTLHRTLALPLTTPCLKLTGLQTPASSAGLEVAKDLDVGQDGNGYSKSEI
jgi:hypothetical protein